MDAVKCIEKIEEISLVTKEDTRMKLAEVSCNIFLAEAEPIEMEEYFYGRALEFFLEIEEDFSSKKEIKEFLEKKGGAHAS